MATADDGSAPRIFTAGAVLNEDSYLLGAPPESTLRAAAASPSTHESAPLDGDGGRLDGDRSSGAANHAPGTPIVRRAAASAGSRSQQPTEVAAEVVKLRFDRTEELIKSEPRLMRLFYGTLAADLAERLAVQSIAIRAAARSLSALHAHDTVRAHPRATRSMADCSRCPAPPPALRTSHHHGQRTPR